MYAFNLKLILHHKYNLLICSQKVLLISLGRSTTEQLVLIRQPFKNKIYLNEINFYYRSL